MKIIANEGINKDVANIKEYISVISEQISYLQNIVNSIPNYWTGSDATRLINKYNDEAIPKLKKFESEFNDYALFLSKIPNIYSALEDAYNKNIDTN